MISGQRNLALLKSSEAIFSKVAQELEASLNRCSLADWDLYGRDLKLLVYEFALLDKQLAPYRAYLEKTPEAPTAKKAKAFSAS